MIIGASSNGIFVPGRAGFSVAITGAIIALQRTTPLPTSQRLPVTKAVAVLAIYWFIWLEYNSTQEKRTAERGAVRYFTPCADIPVESKKVKVTRLLTGGQNVQSD